MRNVIDAARKLLLADKDVARLEARVMELQAGLDEALLDLARARDVLSGAAGSLEAEVTVAKSAPVLEAMGVE